MNAAIDRLSPCRFWLIGRVPPGVATLALVLGGVLLLGGCPLAGDRIESHLERADALLAENLPVEALLELRSAAQLAPDDPAITLRVAETSEDYGFIGDAIDFYRDYLAMVSDDDERAIRLALLLEDIAPKESASLLSGVLERNPSSSQAWLGRAHLALARDDTREAMRHIHKARRLDPENPEVYWALARTHEARIQSIRRRAGPQLQSPRLYEEALDSYYQYWQKGGERLVLALLHRANLLSLLPKRERDARTAYKLAMHAAQTSGSYDERTRVMRTTSKYARRHGYVLIERSALEAWLKIDPSSLTAWELRATIGSRRPGDRAQEIYARMLEAQPDNPGAHVLYSRYVSEQRGFGAGLRHLRDKLGGEMDDAVLLTGIMNLQSANGRRKDAARTLEQLRKLFPGRHATVLLAARQAIGEREWEEAIEILAGANARLETTEGQRLLARASLGRGRYEDALVAIDRAMELERIRSADHLRIRARTLAALGRHSEAAATLRRISRSETPTERDRLMLARAYYESHTGGLGRRILTELMEGESPSKEATLEFARRERVAPAMRMQARRYLARAIALERDDIDLLAAQTELDVLDRRFETATLRLNAAVGRRPKSGDLYLLRARLMLVIGRPKEARNDAERALAVDPSSHEEALEVLSLVYAKSGNPQAGIRSLQAADAAGTLPPDRLVLLGRLQLQVGDEEGALESYERALAGGSQLMMLKNDLAYLLAKTGRDLDRALELAREAVEAESDGLSAADTLGYVLLRSGHLEAAFWQFRFVTVNADPPVAEYYYHLALALIEIDREVEAGVALQRALDISPQFADAESARAQLARISAKEAVPDRSS